MPNVQQSRDAGFEVRSFQVPFNNTHLLLQGDVGVLIDSGGAEGAERLDQMIRQTGFDPAELAAVIVTHGHHDHAGGALHFRKAYGTPIIGGAGDRRLFETGRNDQLCPTGSFARQRFSMDQAGRYEGYTPDILVSRPMDLSRRFGIDARITPVPGHTAGSLVITAGQSAFVGDMIRGTLVPGGAARHFYMCNLADNDRDIAQVLTRVAPEAEQFYMGHFDSAPRAAVMRFLAAVEGETQE